MISKEPTRGAIAKRAALYAEENARKIAELRGEPEAEVFAATARNAARVFGFSL